MRIYFFIFLIFCLFSFPLKAAENSSCQNYFKQWSPAEDHSGLFNAAYRLESSKVRSVFQVMKEGVPYYFPSWNLGLFLHPYSLVFLKEDGTLEPSAKSAGTFKVGDLLVLAKQNISEKEIRYKLISLKKNKTEEGKETDRGTLELVIPKGKDECLTDKNFEKWLKGFGGLLEAENYDKVPVKKTLDASIPNPATQAKQKGVIPLSPSQALLFHSGMTRAEVDALLGKPREVLELEEKTICYYDDVIVEFINNKLSEIHISDKPSPKVLKRFH